MSCSEAAPNHDWWSTNVFWSCSLSLPLAPFCFIPILACHPAAARGHSDLPPWLQRCTSNGCTDVCGVIYCIRCVHINMTIVGIWISCRTWHLGSRATWSAARFLSRAGSLLKMSSIHYPVCISCGVWPPTLCIRLWGPKAAKDSATRTVCHSEVLCLNICLYYFICLLKLLFLSCCKCFPAAGSTNLVLFRFLIFSECGVSSHIKINENLTLWQIKNNSQLVLARSWQNDKSHWISGDALTNS